MPRGRPHPDMIQQLMAQLGVADSGRVAKVGTVKGDLAGAVDSLKAVLREMKQRSCLYCQFKVRLALGEL